MSGDLINTRRCYFCGVSTLRRPRRRNRPSIISYLLTEDYMSRHEYIMEYARHLFDIPQITAQDKICKACLQRARRFSLRQHEVQMQEAAAEATRQIAIDEVYESSVTESVRQSPLDDPLGDVLDNIVKNIQDEQSIQIPQETIQDSSRETSNEPQQEVMQIIPERDAEIIAPEQNILVFPIPGIKRVSYNSTICVIAQCDRRNELHRIPPAIRVSVLSQQDLYIPRGTRVCSEHLGSNVMQDLATHCRPTRDTFNSAQMSDIVKMLKKNNFPYLNFENLDSINEVTFKHYTGYTKDVFLNVIAETPSLSQLKKPKTALATVLCKLHTGECNERLSSLFRMSPQYFGRLMKNVRKCLQRDFVPKHLGFDHIYGPDSAHVYREELRNRILRIPNIIFGSSDPTHAPVISICDGTYFYLQKSTNYSFQRESFSFHKSHHLLKVFIIASPDGYIINTIGPYEANKSDADIMAELISEDENNPFHYFYEEGDVFIFDRGFRDVMGKMQEVGYKAYMPLTKDENERQQTTQQANDSRKVTLCRWVVETINGRLKNQFKQLRSQHSNISAPHLYEEVKIACALINAYGARLVDHELVDQFINQLYNNHDAPNYLSELINTNNFNIRRANFQAIDATEGFEQFPSLTFDEYLIMALGPYQVNQAKSYYAEHIKRSGIFNIEVFQDDINDFNLSDYNIVATEPWLLRAKIQSRHQNSRMYFVYILVDNGLQGRNKIVGYYCNSLVGKRTLGCCAHVMCIIWYMGWARHQETPPQIPAAYLDRVNHPNSSDDES